MDIKVLNTATQKPEVYIGETGSLQVTLTNNTGADIDLQSKSSALVIFMPQYFSLSDLKNMYIDLTDWTFFVRDADYSLDLLYTGADGKKWTEGDDLVFTIDKVKTDESSAQTGSIQINPTNMKGAPIQVQTALNLMNPPQPGNADLKKVLMVNLDNQGTVFVSAKGDPLKNKLFLNFTNITGKPLYDESNPSNFWSGNPTVTVRFIYGSTSGDLAPDDDEKSPVTGSAWNIRANVNISQGNDWTTENSKTSGTSPHPIWLLKPSNTNREIIGTEDRASISFAFDEIISFTPPGHTQMQVLFSGFQKNSTTKYDDAVYVLNIVKQSAPMTRGITGFFSPNPLITMTHPGDELSIPLRWSMYYVDSIRLLTSYPGLLPEEIPYPDKLPVAYDHKTVKIPGVMNSIFVNFTLQAYDGNGAFLNNMQFTTFIISEAFVDTRDNNRVYPIILVDNKFWMTENLDYNMPGESSFYADDSKLEKQYGRLYTHKAAMTNIPDGWRLPSVDDWNDLFNFFGSSQAAYSALIAGGSETFDAQLGGMIGSDSNSSGLGSYGYYWSSDQKDSDNSICAVFSSRSQTVSTGAELSNRAMLSVRYVKDASRI